MRPSRVLVVCVAIAAAVSFGAPEWVTIRRGDTLSKLARKYGTTVEALRELNKLPGVNLIYEGRRLRIMAPVVAPRPKPAPKIAVVHVVQPGDNITRLARRFRTTPQSLAALNKLGRNGLIVVGQRLVIGYRTASPPRVHSTAPKRVPKAQIRALVVAEARRAKVDPALALALAYQESGFQMHLISSAGALGAMQVMPGTGRWVSRHVVGRTLDLADAKDNVIAGVRYLAVLLRVASNTEQALAGYYQGLKSVRERGMLKITKAYVANVLSLRAYFAKRLPKKTANRS